MNYNSKKKRDSKSQMQITTLSVLLCGLLIWAVIVAAVIDFDSDPTNNLYYNIDPLDEPFVSTAEYIYEYPEIPINNFEIIPHTNSLCFSARIEGKIDPLYSRIEFSVNFRRTRISIEGIGRNEYEGLQYFCAEVTTQSGWYIAELRILDDAMQSVIATYQWAVEIE